MHEPADAAHLLAAAGAAGPSMHQTGQRRTMPRRLASAIAIDDQQSAMERASPRTSSRAAASSAVNTEDTRLPSPRRAYAMASAVDVAGNDRAHGPERFHRVNRLRRLRLTTVQQRRRHESALVRIGSRVRGVHRSRVLLRDAVRRCGPAPRDVAPDSRAAPCEPVRAADRPRRPSRAPP